jgi:hypothetical protein
MARCVSRGVQMLSKLASILARLPRLSGEELDQLAQAIAAEQKSRLEWRDDAPVWRVTLRLEEVTCGKKDCHCMNGGAKHGPYYYAYTHKDGKVKSRYIGKRLPEDIEARLRAWRDGVEWG